MQLEESRKRSSPSTIDAFVLSTTPPSVTTATATYGFDCTDMHRGGWSTCLGSSLASERVWERRPQVTTLRVVLELASQVEVTARCRDGRHQKGVLTERAASSTDTCSRSRTRE